MKTYRTFSIEIQTEEFRCHLIEQLFRQWKSLSCLMGWWMKYFSIPRPPNEQKKYGLNGFGVLIERYQARWIFNVLNNTLILISPLSRRDHTWKSLLITNRVQVQWSWKYFTIEWKFKDIIILSVLYHRHRFYKRKVNKFLSFSFFHKFKWTTLNVRIK